MSGCSCGKQHRAYRFTARHRVHCKWPTGGTLIALLAVFVVVAAMQTAQIGHLMDRTKELRSEAVQVRSERDTLLTAFPLPD